MDINEAFIIASRNGLRYQTSVGVLSTEDLWQLPLVSNRAGVENLDRIAIELDRKIKQTGETVSFVNEGAKSPDAELDKVRFDIVLYIIKERKAEIAAATLAKENKARKQRILELIENKQDQSLSEKSIEELKELAKAM